MRQYEDLEKNLCDTIKEWELKIGCSKDPIALYYPSETLLALLGMDSDRKAALDQELQNFSRQVESRLGKLEISEKQGRYCIRIPREGSAYIHQHITANPFLIRFLQVLTKAGSTLEDVEAVFLEFSTEAVKEKDGADTIFYFKNPEIDEYVYCVEEDEFGLEYHRFTRSDYQALFQK